MNTMTNMHIGVAAQKNADIESLSNQVNAAQYKVDELTAVVQSLTEKQGHFTQLLTQADAKKATALSNFNQVKLVATNVTELKRYSTVVNTQTSDANGAICDTSETMATLIDQLIFSVDVIEKLAGFVNRQKAVNKVIPDELVTVLNTATTDANSAVALTLTALQSSYASVSSADEAKTVSDLEQEQSVELENLLMGTGINQQQQKKQFAQVEAALQKVEDALSALSSSQNQGQQRLTDLQNAQQEYDRANEMLESAKSQNQDTSDHQQLVVSARQVLNGAQKAYQQTQSALIEISLQVDLHITILNDITQNQQDTSLFNLVQKSYQTAVTNYQTALDASNMATTQLDSAQAELARATTSLNSLTAGLEAAKAAAYAA